MAQDTLPNTHEPAAEAPTGIERRRNPRRRLRDRIASLDSTSNPALSGRPELKNQMLLVDDDLRQTALVLGTVEQYLGEAMGLIERPDVTAQELAAFADNDDIDERVELLGENLDNLRRRMKAIAMAMRGPRASGGM